MKLQELNGIYTDLSRYIDVAGGMKRILNNKKVYGMLLKSFVGDTHYTALCEQLAGGDVSTAEREAHTIKGVAANLSLPLVYEISEGINSRLKSGNVDVLEDLDRLGKAIEKTVEYMGIILTHIDDIEL